MSNNTSLLTDCYHKKTRLLDFVPSWSTSIEYVKKLKESGKQGRQYACCNSLSATVSVYHQVECRRIFHHNKKIPISTLNIQLSRYHYVTIVLSIRVNSSLSQVIRNMNLVPLQKKNSENKLHYKNIFNLPLVFNTNRLREKILTSVQIASGELQRGQDFLHDCVRRLQNVCAESFPVSIIILFQQIFLKTAILKHLVVL